MLSVLQIVLLSVTGLFALASIVFMIMFIVEINAKEKSTKVKKVSVEEVIEINKNLKEEKETQISVDEMLENLDKQVAEEEKTEEVEEIAVENETAEETQEVIEETEKIEENQEVIKEEKTEVVQEETIQDDKEESKEDIDEEDDDDDDDDDEMFVYEKIEPEAVLAPGTVIDYKARLERILSSKEKLERDLNKVQKFILKYERTDRRKIRNQKMLDRRAGELTNLNLVMYSVTDIKNVDEDKKVKQEELTAHIAELKASIQDAEEYLESNKEKYNHNVKMAKFLTQERSRFVEEIAELKALIKTADENK